MTSRPRWQAEAAHSLPIQPAPATVSLQLVGAVGDGLQFIQHELWNDDFFFQHAGGGDVADAAID